MSGPTSVEAVGNVARACEGARIRVAVLVANHAMQRLQVNRVVKEYAREMARVFSTPDEAESWLTTT